MLIQLAQKLVEIAVARFPRDVLERAAKGSHHARMFWGRFDPDDSPVYLHDGFPHHLLVRPHCWNNERNS
jgi:hypothetical protein